MLDGSLALADLAPAAREAVGGEGRAIATGLVEFVTTDGGSTYQPELVGSQTHRPPA